MTTISGHVIKSTTELENFDSKEYSEFKYAKKSLAKKFAWQIYDKNKLELSNQINEAVANTQNSDKSLEIGVYGAPFNEIPVASSLLAVEFAKLLEETFSISVVNAKISRQHSYHDDYGSMSVEKRKESLSGESFKFIDHPNKYILAIFVDDIFITGAHESRIQALVDNSKVNVPYLYAYHAKLDNSQVCPSFEGVLNKTSILTDEEIERHFISIFTSGDYELNTRTIKFLLSQDVKVLETIFNSSPKKALEDTLKTGSKNNYKNHELYVENYNHLEAFLHFLNK